jgi:O-methyltransferase
MTDDMDSDAIYAFATEFNGAVGRLSEFHDAVSWGDRMLTLDKSFGFMADPRSRGAYEAIRGSHYYDQYGGEHTIAWRLNTLCWAARRALRTGGAFVECGVFKGDMSWVVGEVVGFERIPAMYLFDSFEGFSPRWSSPEDYPANSGYLDFANGIYRADGTLHEAVRARFAAHQNVSVVKGFLPEALEGVETGRIGLLHVDLNAPRAEVAVIEALYDRIVPGGMIVLDDYGWAVFHRQKEAHDELAARLGYDILELPTGQGLVVRR